MLYFPGILVELHDMLNKYRNSVSSGYWQILGYSGDSGQIMLHYQGVVTIFLGASSIILSMISAILNGFPTKPSIPATGKQNRGESARIMRPIARSPSYLPSSVVQSVVIRTCE